MSIDDITLGEIKELKALLGGKPDTGPVVSYVGQKCIIRTYASGVHFGTVVGQKGREIALKNARRLFRFDVKDHGISLSEVANHGSPNSRTRICETVDRITLLDGLEIIPATDKAIRQIESAPVADPK